MPVETVAFDVRPLREGDLEEVILVWHLSKRDAYPYLPLEQTRTLAEDQRFFREVILPRTVVWTAHSGTELAGFLAFDGDYVDRLYIRPDRQRRGAGSALISKAKELSPAGLRLHTHQQNTPARAFYQRHGFRIAGYGISPPPECEPDVEYHWKPAAG